MGRLKGSRSKTVGPGTCAHAFTSLGPAASESVPQPSSMSSMDSCNDRPFGGHSRTTFWREIDNDYGGCSALQPSNLRIAFVLHAVCRSLSGMGSISVELNVESVRAAAASSSGHPYLRRPEGQAARGGKHRRADVPLDGVRQSHRLLLQRLGQGLQVAKAPAAKATSS